MQFASEEMSELEVDLAELESLRRQLADYFCEDERTFKLDDCIKLFAGFFESFIKASQVRIAVAARKEEIFAETYFIG